RPPQPFRRADPGMARGSHRRTGTGSRGPNRGNLGPLKPGAAPEWRTRGAGRHDVGSLLAGDRVVPAPNLAARSKSGRQPSGSAPTPRNPEERGPDRRIRRGEGVADFEEIPLHAVDDIPAKARARSIPQSEDSVGFPTGRGVP